MTIDQGQWPARCDCRCRILVVYESCIEGRCGRQALRAGARASQPLMSAGASRCAGCDRRTHDPVRWAGQAVATQSGRSSGSSRAVDRVRLCVRAGQLDCRRVDPLAHGVISPSRWRAMIRSIIGRMCAGAFRPPLMSSLRHADRSAGAGRPGAWPCAAGCRPGRTLAGCHLLRCIWTAVCRAAPATGGTVAVRQRGAPSWRWWELQ